MLFRSRLRRLFGVVLFAVIAACIGMPANAQNTANKQSEVKNIESSSDLPPIYRKWLDEDVRWIIDGDERQLFTRLKTNEERDRFVELFWLRRDPAAEGARHGGKAPDPTKNAFKIEHYRRIAYANEHLAENAPGWETDRGRIYVVYGSPDEVRRDISQLSHKSELWHYKSIPFIEKQMDVRFVDFCDCGKYSLDPDQVPILFQPRGGYKSEESLQMGSIVANILIRRSARD